MEPLINDKESHTKYHYKFHVSPDLKIRGWAEYKTHRMGTPRSKTAGSTSIHISKRIAISDEQEPYEEHHHRRQKRDLIFRSDLRANHTSCKLYTSREDYSFGFPCQFSDLCGTRKELSEDAESAKTTQDKMTCLRL